MKKSSLMRLAVAVACFLAFESIGALAQSATSADAYSNANIDWQQASGQTIVLAGEQSPWMNAITPLLPKFTALTGIKVEPQTQSEQGFTSKMPVTLAGGSSTPDVYMVWSFSQASTAGWLEPLQSYIDNPKLTDPQWFNFKDFFTSAVQFGTSLQGNTLEALPITAEAETLFINEPMLKAAGLQPPKTFQELYTDAVALKKAGVAGIAMRAQPTASMVPWTAAGFVFSYGGQLIDQNGKAVFDSPQAIAAIEMYAKLLRDAGPPGAANDGWSQVLNAFMQGKTAMAIDTSNFATDIQNPKESTVVGDVSFWPFPSHDSLPSRPNMWHWLVGMNPKSAHKTAAWLFMEWATSEPTVDQLAAAGVAGARATAWQYPDFVKRYGQQAAQAALQNLKAADASAFKRAWYNPKSPQILNEFAVAVNKVIAGTQDAKTALTQATDKANQILGN